MWKSSKLFCSYHILAYWVCSHTKSALVLFCIQVIIIITNSFYSKKVHVAIQAASAALVTAAFPVMHVWNVCTVHFKNFLFCKFTQSTRNVSVIMYIKREMVITDKCFYKSRWGQIQLMAVGTEQMQLRWDSLGKVQRCYLWEDKLSTELSTVDSMYLLMELHLLKGNAQCLWYLPIHTFTNENAMEWLPSSCSFITK